MTPADLGTLARVRAAVEQAFGDAWAAANAAEVAAINEAQRVAGLARKAAHERYGTDYPVACVGCESSDRPECRGCALYGGGS